MDTKFYDENLFLNHLILYKIFAVMLLYPSEENIKNLEELIHLLEARASSDDEFTSKIKEISKELAESDNEKLQSEYVSIFTSNLEAMCPPYEGAYLPPHIAPYLIKELERIYAEEGLQPARNELPDHISCELEFASYLLEKGIEEGNLTKYKAFLKHLMWIPLFLNLLKNNAPDSVYCKIVSLLKEFLELDLEKRSIESCQETLN